MPGQGRLGDKAQVPLDAHGCPACPHPGVGPAIAGSPDVRINSRPALRVGDPGLHAACCGTNTWTATKGSATVFVNGRGAHRLGDETSHCGGHGQLIEGSPNVIVGEATSAGRGVGRASDTHLERGLGAPSVSAGAGGGSGGAVAERARDRGRGPFGSGEDARAAGTEQHKPQCSDFIELELVDALGRPMANERYVVIACDGSVKDGRLDANGFARIEGVVPGTCKVQFPDRHAGDWGRA